MPMNGSEGLRGRKARPECARGGGQDRELKPAQIYASGSGLLELVYNTIEQEEQDEGLFDRIKRVFKKR